MERLEEFFSSALQGVTNSAVLSKFSDGNIYVTVRNSRPTNSHRLSLHIISENGNSIPLLKIEDHVNREAGNPDNQDILVRLTIPWIVLKALKTERFELVAQTPKSYGSKFQRRLVLESYDIDLANRKIAKRK